MFMERLDIVKLQSRSFVVEFESLVRTQRILVGIQVVGEGDEVVVKVIVSSKECIELVFDVLVKVGA